MIAQHARQRKELQREFECNGRGLDAFGQRRVLRFLLVVRAAALQIGTEPADLQKDRLAVRDRGPAALRSASTNPAISSDASIVNSSGGV